MPSLADQLEMFIDPSLCDGCRKCVDACSGCPTHHGLSLIHVEELDVGVGDSKRHVPVLCMHCDEPTCAQVCPADAIKRSDEGIVHTAKRSRCIACNNCVLSCPFGVPRMKCSFELMVKCDMCYHRTAQNQLPLCVEACATRALFFGSRDEIQRLRPTAVPVSTFRFGSQTIHTKVHMLVHPSAPHEAKRVSLQILDVTRTANPVTGEPVVAT